MRVTAIAARHIATAVILIVAAAIGARMTTTTVAAAPAPSPAASTPSSPAASGPPALSSCTSEPPSPSPAAQPSPSSQAPCPPGAPSATNQVPAPASVGGGADGLIQPPDLANGQAPTFSEETPTQAFTPYTSLSPLALPQQWMDNLAGAIFFLGAWITRGAIALMQWAFSFSIFNGAVGGTLDIGVSAMRNGFYLPFAGAVVVLAGAWLMWHGLLRRRATVLAEGALWAVGALVAGAVFFASPSGLVGGADQLSTGLSRQVLDTLSIAVDRQTLNDGITTPEPQPGTTDDTLRIAGDTYFRELIYQPWTVLQFGDVKVGEQYGQQWLQTTYITPGEAQQIAAPCKAGACAQAVSALAQAKQQQQNDIVSQISSDDPSAADWLKGGQPAGRLSVAFLGLIVQIAGAGLLLVLAATVLIAELGVLLLTLVAPLFLLAGVHPGAGRRIAIRWFELIVGLFLKRLLLSALLGAVIVVSAALSNLSASRAGWALAMLLQVGVIVAIVVYRKRFYHLFTGASAATAMAGASRVGRVARQIVLSRFGGAAAGEAAAHAFGDSYEGDNHYGDTYGDTYVFVGANGHQNEPGPDAPDAPRAKVVIDSLAEPQSPDGNHDGPSDRSLPRLEASRDRA